MFKKILIANRGEIACRVIRSCRALGVQTVAVYSDADAGAEHVRLADEAIAIGPAAASESYLVIEKIVEACRQSGAEAVHPGFGFLSENADFVAALDAAGLVFIGPPTNAIAAMGDKITSKALAQEAGVSTVPGHMDLIADEDEAAKIASDIGYPVMIKASAGGGGKGMRVAYDDAEAREGFTSARNEARSSFGDERIFIEKFIEEPRHIEIQVLGDKSGRILHLGERECSIQRRHQKVVEEAPSPFLDEATRAAMGAQAVALSAAVSYHSAGTVEFIVDKDRNFYFLEMNTRIQVEHPVTEEITGQDLVAWMIRIAAGEKLDFGQEDVTLTGWAMECRVYAEDPLRNFLPSIGRLVRYSPPQEGEGEAGTRVRIDSGVVEGSEISIYYDPMIAKLVTYGPDRESARKAMLDALDSYYIRGINHNIAFLASVIEQERFREGRLTTNFIAELYPDGFHGDALSEEAAEPLFLLAAVLGDVRARQSAAITGQISSLSVDAVMAPRDWVVVSGETHMALSVTPLEEGFLVEDDDGETHEVYLDCGVHDPLIEALVDGRSIIAQQDMQGTAFSLSQAGAQLDFRLMTRRQAELQALMPFKAPPDLSKFLLSPMPGLLVSLAVEAGQAVKAGEVLCVVEAMKMENILRAEKDGTVATISAQPGESLVVDQVIMEFE